MPKADEGAVLALKLIVFMSFPRPFMKIVRYSQEPTPPHPPSAPSPPAEKRWGRRLSTSNRVATIPVRGCSSARRNVVCAHDRLPAMADISENGTGDVVPEAGSGNDGQRWLAGVPVIGERRLREEELEELGAFQRELTMAVVRTFGGLLALVAWVAVTQWISIAPLFRWTPILFLLLFIARGGGIRAAAMLRWLRDTRADARDPVVLIGLGPAAESFISVMTIGGPERLTVFSDQEALTVEVLQRSGMLWTYNGRRTVQPMFVARSRTSAAPEHARMAANFVKPLEGLEGVFAHQRSLDEHELEELRSYLTGVPPLRMAVALAMLLFGAGLISLALRPLDVIVMTGGAGPLLIGVARLFALASRMRMVRLLGKDERAGFAVILRQEQDGSLGTPVEILPFSHRVWTKDGAPGLWRKISGER